MEIQFPNKLKMFRRCSGYSQKKVARLLSLSDTSALSRWEHGVILPSIVQVFRLARIYNTVPHELFAELWIKVDTELNLLTQNVESINTNSNKNL